jgi:UDP-N-acetylmuramate--alanine ligase
VIFRRFTRHTRLHFIGIGGSGMSGIAEVLADSDLEISGCDQSASETTDRLRRLGLRVEIGHSPDHLEGVDLVVSSSAVPEDHPELRAARERGITVVRRAEMLAELMRLKYGIAVAGTHGKTTTTSLIGTVLTDAGLDPTVIVGGRVRVLGTGARVGKSELLVAEADEFDRSFLRLAPVLAVITSIDSDHLDTYADLDEIRDAFVTFADRVPFFGQVIVCLDDPEIQRILPRLAERRRVTYGLSPQADLVLSEVESRPDGSRFRVRRGRTDREPGGDLGEIDLPMPGLHNAKNALAAVAVGLALEIPFERIAGSLAGFQGVHRRFERLGEFRGAAVVDDYAHHPTEVTATLAAARQAFPDGKILAVFQPHLYSRTRDQAEALGRALMDADRAVVTDVYPSREEPIPGISGELVVAAARRSGHRHVHYCPAWEDVPPLLEEAGEGDVVLTLGAGDIVRLAERLTAARVGKEGM